MGVEMNARELFQLFPSRFRKDRAGDFKGVFHFRLSGEGGGDFTVIVENGECRVTETLTGEPDCIVKADGKLFVKLATGSANPQMALLTGKLKVSNIPAMMRFMKLFSRRPQGDHTAKEKPQAKSRKPATGPLKGLRIIDLTRLLPGPLATMLMADMGAEVLKIEDPDAPDYIRDFPPQIDGVSAYYHALNRSKRSLSIRYTSPQGRELLHKLIQSADVFIEQFRPGVAAKMGLDYATLSRMNDRLIYVSLTGYGQTGPYATMAGHDLNYQGYAGVLSLLSDEEGTPVMPGIQFADICGGAYMAVIGTLAAVYARNTTGKGQHVDVSMLDGMLPLSVLPFTEMVATGNVPEKHKLPLSGGLPNYNIYRCADGKYVCLAALEPKFWSAFCKAVGKTEWENAITEGSQRLERLKTELSGLFSSKPQDYWISLNHQYDCCLTPLYTLEDVVKDAQIRARNMVIDNGQTAPLKMEIGIPVKFSNTPARKAWDAPALGQDTRAILQEMGLSDEEIDRLNDNDVI